MTECLPTLDDPDVTTPPLVLVRGQALARALRDQRRTVTDEGLAARDLRHTEVARTTRGLSAAVTRSSIAIDPHDVGLTMNLVRVIVTLDPAFQNAHATHESDALVERVVNGVPAPAETGTFERESVTGLVAARTQVTRGELTVRAASDVMVTRAVASDLPDVPATATCGATRETEGHVAILAQLGIARHVRVVLDRQLLVPASAGHLLELPPPVKLHVERPRRVRKVASVRSGCAMTLPLRRRKPRV